MRAAPPRRVPRGPRSCGLSSSALPEPALAPRRRLPRQRSIIPRWKKSDRRTCRDAAPAASSAAPPRNGRFARAPRRGRRRRRCSGGSARPAERDSSARRKLDAVVDVEDGDLEIACGRRSAAAADRWRESARTAGARAAPGRPTGTGRPSSATNCGRGIAVHRASRERDRASGGRRGPPRPARARRARRRSRERAERQAVLVRAAASIRSPSEK